ncbi:MAG: hypothetical protein II011_04960 [Prevotella sp.]|nr:hypothetical protein [Prevotella sp.]
MSEAIAFFCGLVTMTIVWFVNDTKNNPYMRGYAEGLHDGIQEVMKDFDKLMSDMRGENDGT